MSPRLRFILLCLVCQISIGSAFSQTIRINEILLVPDSASKPWIELHNSGFERFNLNGFSIALDRVGIFSMTLPANNINANQYAVIDISALVTFDPIKHVFLLDPQGKLVDSVYIPSTFKKMESYGRFPENGTSFGFFPESKISRGRKNLYPGPWIKLTNHTSFSPRDSAPNAIIAHDNKFWIFEGWEHIAADIYEARSNVWVSTDMVNWELVNDNPPYNPYSAFVSYKGKMWAFDTKCWSSEDGIIWSEESSTFPGALSSRVTILRDTLWFSKARSIGYSVNGYEWFFKLHGTAPWESRSWQGFLAFDDRLWFFGGGDDYGSERPLYYDDVWASANGKDWTLMSYAPWKGRFWFTSAAFNNKIWIFGGYDAFKESIEFGNQNDAWFTEDGVRWTQFTSDNTWENRHAQLTVATDTALYISSGYGGGSLDRLNNDVWKLSLKQPQYFNLDSMSLEYGESYSFASWKYSLFAPSDSIIKVDSDRITARQTGTAPLRLIAASSESHYKNDTIISLSVEKKELQIFPRPAFKFFGEENPSIEIAYSGFVNGDDESSLLQLPSVEILASTSSPVGNYPVKLSGGWDKNYNYVYEEGILIIQAVDNSPIIFPNPATTEVFISNPHCSEKEPTLLVEIINATGQLVKTLTINCLESNRIPLSDISGGIYLIKITSSNAMFLKRLVIS